MFGFSSSRALLRRFDSKRMLLGTDTPKCLQIIKQLRRDLPFRIDDIYRRAVDMATPTRYGRIGLQSVEGSYLLQHRNQLDLNQMNTPNATPNYGAFLELDNYCDTDHDVSGDGVLHFCLFNHNPIIPCSSASSDQRYALLLEVVHGTTSVVQGLEGSLHC